MRDWLSFAGISLLVSVVTFWGLGGLVHYHYYVRRKREAALWKLQPERWLQAGQVILTCLRGASATNGS